MSNQKEKKIIIETIQAHSSSMIKICTTFLREKVIRLVKLF